MNELQLEKHLKRVYEKMPKWIKDNLIILTLGGSHAYGTNVEGSDIDIRGVCLNTKEQLMGLEEFEQWVDVETDTTIYSFNKLVKLLINTNPNTVEILGNKHEDYIVLTKEGKLLMDNADLFLSKKAIYSFGGYATAQLRRLQNALARDEYAQPEKEEHIMKTIDSMKVHFMSHYSQFELNDFNIYTGKTNKPDMELETFIDINLKHYPLRDFVDIHSEMNNVIKDYGKMNKRNNKKDESSLYKHAMHLIRLYLMLFDILKGNGIRTYRGNENSADHIMLMNIRNGKVSFEDIFLLVDDFEKQLKTHISQTTLPEQANIKKINELMVEVNKTVILREEY